MNKMLKLFALNLGATLVVPAAGAQGEYKRFADVMTMYGYTWEAKKVQTEDGFVLTTFHVTGNKAGRFTPTKPPILVQHGATEDAALWIDWYRYFKGVPMPL